MLSDPQNSIRTSRCFLLDRKRALHCPSSEIGRLQELVYHIQQYVDIFLTTQIVLFEFHHAVDLSKV